METTKSNSVGEALAAAHNAAEIEARQQAYRVATDVVMNSMQGLGNTNPKVLADYWSSLADGVYQKIRADMDSIFKNA